MCKHEMWCCTFLTHHESGMEWGMTHWQNSDCLLSVMPKTSWMGVVKCPVSQFHIQWHCCSKPKMEASIGETRNPCPSNAHKRFGVLMSHKDHWARKCSLVQLVSLLWCLQMRIAKLPSTITTPCPSFVVPLLMLTFLMVWLQPSCDRGKLLEEVPLKWEVVARFTRRWLLSSIKKEPDREWWHHKQGQICASLTFENMLIITTTVDKVPNEMYDMKFERHGRRWMEEYNGCWFNKGYKNDQKAFPDGNHPRPINNLEPVDVTLLNVLNAPLSSRSQMIFCYEINCIRRYACWAYP